MQFSVLFWLIPRSTEKILDLFLKQFHDFFKIMDANTVNLEHEVKLNKNQ